MPRILLILLVLTFTLVLAARVWGPSDVHDKSQPKTIAYTADVVLHGRWMLPRDMAGLPARKPPLYNWVGAPFVAAFGWDEWVLKVPSILSGVATVIALVVVTRRMLADPDLDLDPAVARAGGYVAGIFWLASYPAMKLVYLARPDMPLVACLTVAWALATVALTAPAGRRTWPVALGFWLCIAGAGLTKGPPALIGILYALIAARPLAGSFIGGLRRTGLAWGLPLALLLIGGWVWGAYREAPDHFVNVLWGEEIAARVTRGEPLTTQSFAHPWWITPWWFLRKFVPWSLLAVVAVVSIRPTRWVRHPVTPTILWVALVLVFFAVPTGKRTDYLAPAYPAGAALAAYAALVPLRRLGGRPVLAGVAGFVMAVALSAYQWKAAPEAVDPAGERIKAFVRDVEARVGAGEPIVFTELGWHPVQTLLGRHQTDPFDPATLGRDGWAIAPVSDVVGVEPDVTSGEIPQVRHSWVTEERTGGRLGLYRLPIDPTAFQPPTPPAGAATAG